MYRSSQASKKKEVITETFVKETASFVQESMTAVYTSVLTKCRDMVDRWTSHSLQEALLQDPTFNHVYRAMRRENRYCHWVPNATCGAESLLYFMEAEKRGYVDIAALAQLFTCGRGLVGMVPGKVLPCELYGGATNRKIRIKSADDAVLSWKENAIMTVLVAFKVLQALSTATSAGEEKLDVASRDRSLQLSSTPETGGVLRPTFTHRTLPAAIEKRYPCHVVPAAKYGLCHDSSPRDRTEQLAFGQEVWSSVEVSWAPSVLRGLCGALSPRGHDTFKVWFPRMPVQAATVLSWLCTRDVSEFKAPEKTEALTKASAVAVYDKLVPSKLMEVQRLLDVRVIRQQARVPSKDEHAIEHKAMEMLAKAELEQVSTKLPVELAEMIAKGSYVPTPTHRDHAVFDDTRQVVSTMNKPMEGVKSFEVGPRGVCMVSIPPEQRAEALTYLVHAHRYMFAIMHMPFAMLVHYSPEMEQRMVGRFRNMEAQAVAKEMGRYSRVGYLYLSRDDDSDDEEDYARYDKKSAFAKILDITDCNRDDTVDIQGAWDEVEERYGIDVRHLGWEHKPHKLIKRYGAKVSDFIKRPKRTVKNPSLLMVNQEPDSDSDDGSYSDRMSQVNMESHLLRDILLMTIGRHARGEYVGDIYMAIVHHDHQIPIHVPMRMVYLDGMAMPLIVTAYRAKQVLELAATEEDWRRVQKAKEAAEEDDELCNKMERLSAPARRVRRKSKGKKRKKNKGKKKNKEEEKKEVEAAPEPAAVAVPPRTPSEVAYSDGRRKAQIVPTACEQMSVAMYVGTHIARVFLSVSPVTSIIINGYLPYNNYLRPLKQGNTVGTRPLDVPEIDRKMLKEKACALACSLAATRCAAVHGYRAEITKAMQIMAMVVASGDGERRVRLELDNGVTKKEFMRVVYEGESWARCVFATSGGDRETSGIEYVR